MPATKFVIDDDVRDYCTLHTKRKKKFDLSWTDNKATGVFEYENHENERIVLRSERIEIFPTKKQKRIINKWIDYYETIYNKTVMIIKKEGIKNVNEAILRKKLQNLPMFNNSEVTFRMVRQGIKDVIKAYKTCFSLLRKKQIKAFRIRYKKRSNTKRTIELESHYFSKKKNAFCVKLLGEIESSEDIKGITKTCRLQKYNGRFFIYAPKERITKVNNSCETISLDPGVRTFMTGYHVNNIIEYGINPNYSKEFNKIDKLNNAGKENGWNRRLKKKLNRTYTRIHNKTADLHWKVANHLCRNFETILLGKLSTKDIVNNEKSCLRKITKRKCYALSHFSFQERLKSKADEYGINFHLVDESYTSKTCSECGFVNESTDIKTFNCAKCKFKCDRDLNGARNIALKHPDLWW